MTRYTPLEVAFLRYFAAALPLTLYCAVKKTSTGRTIFGDWIWTRRRTDFRIIVVAVLTFYISPYLQMVGISKTRAIDGTLMIATEPLLTVVAACFILRERLKWEQLASIALALVGICVVTELTWEKLKSFSDVRLIGNLIVLSSMLSEAAYSIVAKPALERRSPLIFVTLALLMGSAILFAHNIIFSDPSRLAGLVPLFHDVNLKDFAAIMHLGWGCTTFGYLYWMIVLRETPLSVMALTLYVQPVLGTIWGYLFLREEVTASTFVGGLLIVVALWLGSRPQRG